MSENKQDGVRTRRDQRSRLQLCLVRILGLDFFEGTPASAVDEAVARRGLVVAPSGTCFSRLAEDPVYRMAITSADLVLPDSGLMVMLWRRLRRQTLHRISGLAYLQEMLRRPELKSAAATLWVLPDEIALEKTASWLREHRFDIVPEDFYVAPMYGRRVEDDELAARIDSRRPRHVVIALSGGVQEKLGFYLRERSEHRPAIHCIGAALGFVTGYQIAIPRWADQLYLGWLFRLLSNPGRFAPRALNALSLPGMIRKYGEELPVLRTE